MERRTGYGMGRRRDAARTRAALLAAGAELFAESGYDAVPVAAIAERAKVNKAMINYHFGGKRQLYHTIVRTTFEEIVTRVEALADAERPALALLQDVIAVIGDTAARRSPHFCTMMLREVLTGGSHLEAGALDAPARLLSAVQRIVARGVREGTLRSVDPVLTHLSLVGSLVFFFATGPFRERVLAARPHLGLEAPTPEAYVQHLQELIAHGLAAPIAVEASVSATTSRPARHAS